MTTTIGIDYTSAIHQAAGIGRYTREMVKALATLTQPDFSPHYQLFVANAGKNFSRTALSSNLNWSLSQLSERWLARLWYRLRLPVPIQYWTGPIKLFHAPDFILPPVTKGTRTVVTIHDLSFVQHPDSVMPGMSQHLNQWVPRSVARANHVVAVSEATKQDLVDLYNTPSAKISVLYHGVTPEYQPIEDESTIQAIWQKYKLGNDPFILSIGTIQPRKNYQRLIQAFAQIEPPTKLVIAGVKGWSYQEIYGEVVKQGLEQRVTFTGFVDDADLPALYNAATLFTYPSLYEGFGLPVLESMACGTPVIASNQSSLPEVVGQAGVLVDPYDVDALATAMGCLLSSEQQQQQLAQAGLSQAAKFTWAGMATELLALYQKILEE